MKTTKVANSGKMCSGKTTMAEFLVENFGFTRMAIGDQIKNLSNMVIEDHRKLEKYLDEMMPEYAGAIETEFKEYWDEVKNLPFEKKGNIYLKNEAYRGMTQKTGDIVRSKYGEDVWIHLLKKQADKIIDAGGKVVCDDVRLKPEKSIFEQDGYTVFRLEIEADDQKQRIIQMYNTYDPKALQHKTETDLDDVVFAENLTINTTQLSIEDCYRRIKAELK